MKNKVFAVYDSKTKIYRTPFHLRSTGEALRSWQTVANDRETQIGQHPADFALLEIAEWDDETGQYESHAVPKNLGLAIEFVVSQPKPIQNLGGNLK